MVGLEIVSKSDAIERGLKRYFNGKPCKKGHISERSVGRDACIECHNERNRKYYHKTLEHQHKRAAEYHRKNKDKASEYGRIYREKNKEKLREIRREYKAKNKEKIREQSKEWWVKTREERLLKKREYYENNREKYRSYVRNRRAISKFVEGIHNEQDIAIILKRQKFLCAEPSCKKSIKGGKHHVDHIFPISKGGTNWPNNLQCLCANCNLRKHAKDPLDWARENGRLV